MEALKCHRLSHHRYRSHLNKIIAVTKELIDKDPSELMESDITSLADWQKLLDQKKEIFTDVDAKTTDLSKEEGELESDILETEEIQEAIFQQAAQGDRVLRLYCYTHPDPSTVVTGPKVPTPGINTEDSTTSSETESIPATDNTLNTSVNSELPVTATSPVIRTTHAVTSAMWSHPQQVMYPYSQQATYQVAVELLLIYLSSVYQFSQVIHCNGSLSGTALKQLYIITPL